MFYGKHYQQSKPIAHAHTILTQRIKYIASRTGGETIANEFDIVVQYLYFWNARAADTSPLNRPSAGWRAQSISRHVYCVPVQLADSESWFRPLRA